jgi:hypothetical protein
MLRRVFIVWTGVLWTCIVIALLVWSGDSSSCEGERSLCIDTGDAALAIAFYVFVIWLLGVVIVGVAVGLFRYGRRVMSNYDGA